MDTNTLVVINIGVFIFGFISGFLFDVVMRHISDED